LRAIQGEDTENRVIHYGSFFETLSSAIGGGFLVVPAPMVDAFVEVSRRLRHQPAAQIQEGLAGFIDEHEYAVHARNVRTVYAKRLEVLKQACSSFLPEFSVSEPLGGLHLVISLDERFDESALCAQAVAQGLPIAPLSLFYRRPGQKKGIVIGFGAVPERLIHPIVKQLASLLARGGDFERVRASA
jgi:GntR family transcriptional regulator/MocR family aminotransferase